MITSMMCSTITSVTPVSWIFFTSAIACCNSAGVSPASASSSSISRGPVASTRAISSRLRPGVPSAARAQVLPVGRGPTSSSTLSACAARVGAVRMAQERADHHVVENGHVLERRRHLEGAPDAEPRMLFRRGARHVGAVEQ